MARPVIRFLLVGLTALLLGSSSIDVCAQEEYSKAYICPMYCTDLISTQPGECPVCKMSLQEKKAVENPTTHKIIFPKDAWALLQTDEKVLLLDVRTQAEFEGKMGHLSGALLIPIRDLEERIDELTSHKEKTIITYCSHGIRSARAAQILSARGFNALSLAGGLTKWNREQLPRVQEKDWKITITSADEPGEPMIVSGTVYAKDGRTPVAGITVYVYHTDNEGYYRKGANTSRDPRLKGTMVTNSNGKYEYRSIKPTSYPGREIPAHVHYVISGEGYSKQYDELRFEGDSLLNQKEVTRAMREGTFATIRPLSRDEDGIWRCVKDIRLK